MKKAFALALLPLFLASCGGSDGTLLTGPDTRPSPLRIAGKVTGQAYRLGSLTILTGDGRRIARAEADDQGNFAFDLSKVTPDPADLTGNFVRGCTGENSNPAARLLTVPNLSVYGSQGDYLGWVQEYAVAGSGVKPGESYLLRAYADAAVSFSGSCQAGKETDRLQVSLTPGWNILLATPSADGFSIVNAPADVQTTLKFEAATPSVRVLLKSATLSFTSDTPVTVEADVAQVGGYSGPVTLGTDVAGLTVEPATLNLPALPAQSLGEQLVKTQLTFRYSGEKTLETPFKIIVRDAAGKVVGSGGGQLKVQR